MNFIAEALSDPGKTEITNRTGHEIFITLKYLKGFGKCAWGKKRFKVGETATDEYNKVAQKITIRVEGRGSSTEFVVDMDGQHRIGYNEKEEEYTIGNYPDWLKVMEEIGDLFRCCFAKKKSKVAATTETE